MQMIHAFVLINSDSLAYELFGRLQVRTGQKQAAAIVARTQRGAKAGSKPVPVSKHPCYIVQRCTSPASTSRSRFQITMDQSAGAKVGLASRSTHCVRISLAHTPIWWDVAGLSRLCASGRRL